MGKHTVRILRGLLGVIGKRMDEHAGGNGGGKKMRRLAKERDHYRRELEKRDRKGGRIH